MNPQERSRRARDLYIKWLDIEARAPGSKEAERAYYAYDAMRTGRPHRRIDRTLVICALLAIPLVIALAAWLAR